MATTKDRLDELTRRERELDDHVVALEDGRMKDGEVPPVAAGNRPAVAVLRTSLRGRLGRLLEPLSGRWAAIGAVAWVVLLGIGIAVEPPPTNPNVVDPWFLNVLGAVLLAAVVAAFAGFWLRQRWSMAASLLHPACWWSPPSPAQRPATTPSSAPGGSSNSAAGYWAGERPALLAGLNRARRSNRPPVRRLVTAVRAVHSRKLEQLRLRPSPVFVAVGQRRPPWRIRGRRRSTRWRTWTRPAAMALRGALASRRAGSQPK